MQTRISIAMATYNGAKYLRTQLDSLKAQTLQPHELVICDDGSRDSTLDIAETFAAESTFPVKIVRNETNLGYADNFLKAASLCEGDWIAFCDQDDFWCDNKLEVVAENFTDSILLVVHSAILTDNNLTELGGKLPSIQNKITKDLRNNHPMKIYPGFACVFHSKLVNKFSWNNRPNILSGPRGKVSHDWWIYWLANVFGDICYVPDVLALYRRHDETVTAPLPKNFFHKFIKIINIKEENYLNLAQLAKGFYMYLNDLSLCESDEYHSSCVQGQNLYRRVYLLNSLRSDIYSSTNILAKVKCLLVLVRNKGYFTRDTMYSFGARSFAKDLFIVLTSIFR